MASASLTCIPATSGTSSVNLRFHVDGVDQHVQSGGLQGVEVCLSVCGGHVDEAGALIDRDIVAGEHPKGSLGHVPRRNAQMGGS